MSRYVVKPSELSVGCSMKTGETHSHLLGTVCSFRTHQLSPTAVREQSTIRPIIGNGSKLRPIFTEYSLYYTKPVTSAEGGEAEEVIVLIVGPLGLTRTVA